jgi:hypothetical protein
MILAEIIDGILCKMSLNEMETITDPNVRDIIVNVDTYLFLQLRGNILKIAINIEVCSDYRLQPLSFK